MDTWTHVFLGIIALAGLVQAAFLVGLALAARRIAKKVEALEDQLLREVRPTLDKVSDLSEKLVDVSAFVLREGERIDSLVTGAARKIDDGTSALRRVALRASEPFASVAAFFKGVLRGARVYKELGSEPRAHEASLPEGARPDPRHVEPPAVNLGRAPEAPSRQQAEI